MATPKKKVTMGGASGKGAFSLSDVMSGVSRMVKSETGKAVSSVLAPHVKAALTTAGAGAGGMGAAYLGLPPSLGSAAGTALGARLSRAIGSGDYEVKADVVENSLFKASKGGSMAPTFASSGNSVRLKHREYIGDIYAGANNSFSIAAYAVQPGSSTSFPFLSQISENFSKYKFHGLIYEFVSTTSPYLAGGSMGSVIMAMQYDAALPAFATKPQMENSDFAISARPDNCIMYGVECKDQLLNGLFVRGAATTVTQPINFTDLGTMYVAVQNTTIAQGASLGELWVTYDIELGIPLISPSRYGWSRFTYNNVASVQPTAPILANASSAGNNTLFTAVVAGPVTTFSLVGATLGDYFEVVINYYIGASSALVTGANIALTGLAGTALLGGFCPSGAGAASNQYMVSQLYVVTSTIQTPTFVVTSPIFTTAAAWGCVYTINNAFGPGVTL